jgi:hypothetical protein
MHHDLLAELYFATCCFKSLGGISWLDGRQKRQVCVLCWMRPLLSAAASQLLHSIGLGELASLDLRGGLCSP